MHSFLWLLYGAQFMSDLMMSIFPSFIFAFLFQRKSMRSAKIAMQSTVKEDLKPLVVDKKDDEPPKKKKGFSGFIQKLLK